MVGVGAAGGAGAGRPEHRQVDAERQELGSRPPHPSRRHRLKAEHRTDGHEIRATQRDRRRPAPAAAERGAVPDVGQPDELAAHHRHHRRPADEPSGDGRHRTRLVRPQPVDEVDRPAPMEPHDRPDAARQHVDPSPRPARPASPERGHPHARDLVRGTRRRVPERDDSAVVDAPDALDEVDDRRHPGLVALHDEARDDDDDAQASHVDGRVAGSLSPPAGRRPRATRYATIHNPRTIHAHVRPAVGPHV